MLGKDKVIPKRGVLGNFHWKRWHLTWTLKDGKKKEGGPLEQNQQQDAGDAEEMRGEGAGRQEVS